MLISARSSQDFPRCCRATASARSKYAVAFAACVSRPGPHCRRGHVGDGSAGAPTRGQCLTGRLRGEQARGHNDNSCPRYSFRRVVITGSVFIGRRPDRGPPSSNSRGHAPLAYRATSLTSCFASLSGAMAVPISAADGPKPFSRGSRKSSERPLTTSSGSQSPLSSG